MKVWVVVTDDYPGLWGAEVYCHGVYTSRAKALEVLHEMRQGVPDSMSRVYERNHIHAIELDEDSNVYLGGYTE